MTLDLLAGIGAFDLIERTSSTLRVQQVVQLSLAPAFLLAGIGAVMNVMTNRLIWVANKIERILNACHQCRDRTAVHQRICQDRTGHSGRDDMGDLHGPAGRRARFVSDGNPHRGEAQPRTHARTPERRIGLKPIMLA